MVKGTPMLQNVQTHNIPNPSVPMWVDYTQIAQGDVKFIIINSNNMNSFFVKGSYLVLFCLDSFDILLHASLHRTVYLFWT